MIICVHLLFKFHYHLQDYITFKPSLSGSICLCSGANGKQEKESKPLHIGMLQVPVMLLKVQLVGHMLPAATLHHALPRTEPWDLHSSSSPLHSSESRGGGGGVCLEGRE